METLLHTVQLECGDNMKEVEKVELDLFFFFATLQFQLPFFIFINMDFGENSEVHFLTLSLTADNLNQ